MKISTWPAMAALVVVPWCFMGCEAPLPSVPPQSASTPLDSAGAWTEWQEIAAQGQGQWDVDHAAALTETMLESPAGLRPMIRAVGDETVPPHVKVLIVICLTPLREQLTPYIEDVTALTMGERSSGVRTFGTHLLGLLDDAKSVDAVIQLLDDKDQAVRESAMGVLVAVHGPRVSDRIQAFWDDPDTTMNIREQIILGMAPELVEKHLPLYEVTLLNHGMSAAARYKAATVLGQVGTPDHVAVLQESVDSDPDSYVRERAAGGLALLKAKLESSPSDPSTGALP